MLLGAEMFVVVNGVLYVLSDGVKRLAHTIPLSGHLAYQKTTESVPVSFALPCTQMCLHIAPHASAVRRSARAPLYPLPLNSTLFWRIDMDIIGTLERSGAGNQYILVICEYLTWYTEAFPLCMITTAKINQQTGTTLF